MSKDRPFKRFWNNIKKWAKRVFGRKTPTPTLRDKEPLLTTSRKEIDGNLTVVEGTYPDDLYGAFYVSLPTGSVNSVRDEYGYKDVSLPFPEKTPDGKRNAEYGSPIMNGDGMVIKVDFDAGDTPAVKSRLMKTPCYYADEATKYGTEHHELFGFHNMGITRMSMWLGARNELNTAVQPVKFEGQQHSSMLATYDVGRPYVIDAQSLDLITPIAKSTDWLNAQPAAVPWPFGIVQTSAHPQFDPLTKELFTVNYSKIEPAVAHEEEMIKALKHDREGFGKKLLALATLLHDHKDQKHVEREVRKFFQNLGNNDDKKESKKEEKAEVYTYLMVWDGNNPVKKWTLKNQHGEKISIAECMHQMGLTKDYVILTDCAFKFALDLLFNNPLPEHKLIEKLLRRVTTQIMEPFTRTYIVNRKDLVDGVEEVTAYELDKPIPYETIHYSCDYANPNNEITLYGMHNAATCIAEWVRTFDTRATDFRAVDPQYFSLFAVGSMDLSRLGKWKIDAENYKLLEDKSTVFEDAGNWKEDNLGPNTWTIVLHTYRDIISSTKTVDTIKQMWYVADGTDNNLLTDFIYKLYEDYPNRTFPLDDIKEATKKELPFSITRVNVETMKPEDYYQCDPKVYVRAVQFMPKKEATPGVPYELDGYLFAPVQVGEKKLGKWNFTSQFWIFDATNIAQGPICKLEHDEVKFAFTLHTAWVEEALTSDQKYTIPVKEDYDEVLAKIKIEADRKLLTEFFEKNVYPHF